MQMCGSDGRARVIDRVHDRWRSCTETAYEDSGKWVYSGWGQSLWENDCVDDKQRKGRRPCGAYRYVTHVGKSPNCELVMIHNDLLNSQPIVIKNSNRY